MWEFFVSFSQRGTATTAATRFLKLQNRVHVSFSSQLWFNTHNYTSNRSLMSDPVQSQTLVGGNSRQCVLSPGIFLSWISWSSGISSVFFRPCPEAASRRRKSAFPAPKLREHWVLIKLKTERKHVRKRATTSKGRGAHSPPPTLKIVRRNECRVVEWCIIGLQTVRYGFRVGLQTFDTAHLVHLASCFSSILCTSNWTIGLPTVFWISNRNVFDWFVRKVFISVGRFAIMHGGPAVNSGTWMMTAMWFNTPCMSNLRTCIRYQ